MTTTTPLAAESKAARADAAGGIQFLKPRLERHGDSPLLEAVRGKERVIQPRAQTERRNETEGR